MRGFVGRYGDDVERINPLEFLLFRLRRARHARQLPIHAEEILESYRGKRLVLAAYLDVLLGFDCLVQTLVVATAYHNTPRELVHYQHLAVRNNIIAVALHKVVRFQRLLNVVIEFRVVEVGEIGYVKIAFRLRHAVIGEHYGALFFLYGEIVALAQSPRKRIRLLVQVARFAASARYYERSARLVDENGVHLVDDCEVEFALNLVRLAHDHIVAQKVEAQFVVGAIGYVACVRRALLLVFHAGNDHAHAQSEKTMHLAHPRRVTRGEIVVDGDDVHAFARQRVEIRRHRSDKRFAFARAHLGDSALMQSDTAHKLNEERTQPEHPVRRLAYRCERVGENVIERLALCQTLLELRGLCGKLFVAQSRVFGRQRVDFFRDFAKLPYLSFVFVEN